MSDAFYLGLDCGTQSLKAIVIDAEAGDIVFSEAVNFSSELPEYRCPNGALEHPDPLIKRADPLLWAAALDLSLEKAKKAGAPLGKVRAVSGSGQQHGSVYLNARFPDAMKRAATSGGKLAEAVAPSLSRSVSPIWMDSSTRAECDEISAAVGADALRAATGSFATERFTGPQIRKFFKEEPEAWRATGKVHLVSSFMASLLIGENAPIDFGDGAGMNLLDIRQNAWSAEIAAATAPGLLDKLPPAVAGDAIVGKLSGYFKKYGFGDDVNAVVWSGDNPSSLIGMGAWRPGVAVVSLGTSDTFFAAMRAPTVDPDGYGHVFGNPAGGFMSLICFKNGSLAREALKNRLGVDWDFFGADAFAQSETSRGRNLMCPYYAPEITPLVLTPSLRFRGDNDFESGEASPAVRVRALVESQALSMRSHSRWIGTFDKLRVTGGASRASGIRETLADVFQAPVEQISVPDSAALGAAMMAAHAVGKYDWEALSSRFSIAANVTRPRAETAEIYADALNRYRALEREFQNGCR